VVINPPVSWPSNEPPRKKLIGKTSEYYDQTLENTPIAFDGASIFSTLEGFYQKIIPPKRSETALEWGSHSATMTLINLSVSMRLRSLLARCFGRLIA
jgi:hypothetical protein